MTKRKILIALIIIQIILIGWGFYLFDEGQLVYGYFIVLVNLIFGLINFNTLKNLS